MIDSDADSEEAKDAKETEKRFKNDQKSNRTC